MGGDRFQEERGLRQLLAVGVARVVRCNLKEHVLYERQVALDEFSDLGTAKSG